MYKLIKRNSDKLISVLAIFSLLFNLSQPILIVHAEAAGDVEADDEVVVEEEASEETSSEENTDEAIEDSSSEEEALAEETEEVVEDSGTSAPVDGEEGGEEEVVEEEVTEEESGEVLGDFTKANEETTEEEAVEEEQEGDILEDGAKDYRPPEEEIIEEDGIGDTEEVVETDGVEPEVEVIEEEEVENTVCLSDDQEVVESEEADWEIDGDVAETKDDVRLGVKYVFPLEEEVSVTFTCLPNSENDLSGLKIERIDTDELDLPEGYTSSHEYAFDISTDMEEGDYEFELTLPKDENEATKVTYIEKSRGEDISEDDIKAVDEDKVEEENDSITVRELNHFSIWVVVSTHPLHPALNGANQVTVAPGETINVSLKVRLNWDDWWRSTAYKIEGDSWECIDTPDHRDNVSGSVYYVENFDITAPNSDGEYDVSFRVYEENGCSRNSSRVVTLRNAIVVEKQGVVNPPLPQACGLDIALVIDTSGSIDDSELAQMKNAFKSFVSALLPGTPTQFSVTEFDTSATVLQTFTSDKVAVDAAIDSASGGGWTNWEDGLLNAQSTLPNRTKPDLVLFASDGNPTTSDGPLSNLEDAVVVADAIKIGGARILALGIGNGLNIDNLKAIAGPNVNTGDVLTSDVITTDFSTLADDLYTFASQTCGGTITVNKYIDQVDENSRAGAGWEFMVAGTTRFTDSNGQTEPVTVNSQEPVSVVETAPLSGYSLVSAACKINGDAAGTPVTGGVSGLVLGQEDIVSCDFVNAENAGSILGMKWGDTNGDRQRGDNELGLSAWTIFIDEDGNGVLDEEEVSTQTDESGNYEFTDLEPGTYSVCEVEQAYYLRTFPVESNCHEVEVLPGGEVTNVDFGNMEILCGNGRLDDDEECDGEAGVTEGENFCTFSCNLVPIYNGDATCSEGFVKGDLIASVDVSSTDENGEFINLSSGVEYLFEASKTFVPTSAAGYVSDAGHTWINGIYQPQYGIYGVAPDLGAHSLLGNLGLGVGIVNWGGAQAVTHEYSFAYTPTNDEQQFVIGDRFDEWFGTKWDNQDGMKDNEGDLHLDVFECEEVTGSIQGRKYYDVNVNGDFDQFEKDEPGNPNRLNGWTINLYDDSWNLVDSMETGANNTPAGNVGKGQYRFVGLSAGTYRVCEELQDGWIQTEPSSGYIREGSYCHEVTLAQGQDINTIQFGNYEGADVRICKIDQDENPLAGWEVVLVGQRVDGPKLIDVTNSSGTDSDFLPAGKYLIKVSGTYRFGDWGEYGIADAEWAYRNDIYTDNPLPAHGWTQGENTYLSAYGLDAQVENNPVNWGTFDSGHTYTYVYDHSGGSINIHIYDNYYGDNVNNGNFQFEIYEIDEELYGTTEDDGCVELENVPYGEYILDEFLPEGWIDLESKGEEVVVDDEDEEFTLVNRYDEPVTIVATKIVCEDESLLPNWGTGHGGIIDADFAQEYVNEHPGCYLEEGWEFQWGDDSVTNPGDEVYGKANGWNDFDTATDANGEATVEIYDLPDNLNQGIKVREVLQENHIPFTFTTNGNSNEDNYSAEIYCHEDILNYDNDDRVRNAEYGGTYYCVAWNVPQLEDIYGYKWNDLDADRFFDRCLADTSEGDGEYLRSAQENGDGEEPVCEEKISDWTMYLYDDSDNLLGTTTTDEEGNYIFEDLSPGTYKVCEDIQDGWYQTFPGLDGVVECHTITLPSPCSRNQNGSVAYAYNPDSPPTQKCDLNFGNVLVDVGLDIEKSNGSISDESPGNTVEYTIGIYARNGPVFNVQVTDLLPEGFDYQGSSWQANSTSRGDLKLAGITPEPTYASPGVWDLGDMEEGEVVTLTYTADIDGGIDPGLYKDIAWAQGKNVIGDDVLADAICMGVLDDNFVGTEVNVTVDSEPGEVETDVDEEIIEEQVEEVLGASTYLPATGSNTDWLYTAIAALLIGLVNIFIGTMIMRKKYKELKILAVTGLLFGYAFIFSGNVLAAETMVRMEEPAAKANGPFEISYVVQDTQNRTVEVSCLVKKPGSVWLVGFENHSLQAGGDSGICSVDNSVLTDEGDYEFAVRAEPNGGTAVETSPVSVSYDGEGPERPKYIEKDKDGNCRFEIEIKTHGDGETSYIEVYADDDTNIEANAGSRIKTVTVGPDEKVEFDHDLFGSDCGKTFYYAVRAFDDHDNPSDLRAEEVTKTKTVTVTTTEETEEETIEAIAVGEGTILGDQDQEAGDEETGEGQESEDGDILGEEDEDGMQDDGLEMGPGRRLTNILKWGLVIAVVVFFGNVIRKRRNN